jgi:dihydroorotase
LYRDAIIREEIGRVSKHHIELEFELGQQFKCITTKQIEVVRESWTVPTLVNGVVPLAAGQTLEWKVK